MGGEEPPVDCRFSGIASRTQERWPVVKPGESQEEYREGNSTAKYPRAPCAYEAAQSRLPDQDSIVEPERDCD